MIGMRKRKLQIFLSSTYEDLVGHRLAAIEAILGAGHIPAAMEQFAPGDETAWEKIKAWIDESDAFILILGGRYGSIEPTSGKSYVELEYEYAIEKKKPFFALVVTEKHHNKRVQKLGLDVHERDNPDKYKKFKIKLTEKLCRFWDDRRDIQSAIFQKLPEWAQRTDLIGWVRGDEATGPEVMNELARLSHENRELRRAAADSAQTFVGLSFDDLFGLLADRPLSRRERNAVLGIAGRKCESILHAFEGLFASALEIPDVDSLTAIMDDLSQFGLVRRFVASEDPGLFSTEHWVRLTDDGLRFRNRLLVHKKSILTKGSKRTI